MPRPHQSVGQAKLASKKFDYTLERVINDLEGLGLPGSMIEDIIRTIGEKDCPFCIEKITTPAIFNKSCDSCSKIKLRACITCLRTYLELNTPKSDRVGVKHLFCPKVYDTWNLNGDNLEIDMGYLRGADRFGIKPPDCPKCGMKFTSNVEGYAHLSPSWKEYLGFSCVPTCAMLGK